MAKKKIVLVDDAADAVAYVTAALENDDREILSARDGAAGLKLIREACPDLVVLDVQMPKKDGVTVFAELKDDEATKHIPVIMLTGVGQKTGIEFSAADMHDFVGVRPEGYIEKPVDAEALAEMVEKILGE